MTSDGANLSYWLLNKNAYDGVESVEQEVERLVEYGVDEEKYVRVMQSYYGEELDPEWEKDFRAALLNRAEGEVGV